MTPRVPILRLFLARMNPAYFQLSEEERRQFMARDRANLDALGMQAIAMIDCHDQTTCGIHRYPRIR